MTLNERRQLKDMPIENSVSNVLHTLAEICCEYGEVENFMARHTRKVNGWRIAP